MQIIRENSTDFYDFITNLRVLEHKRVRNAILCECGVSRTTFSKWVRGTATPRDINKSIINKIAQSYGYKNVY